MACPSLNRRSPPPSSTDVSTSEVGREEVCRAASLAAIPAGESPASRDAMGRAAMKSRPSADFQPIDGTHRRRCKPRRWSHPDAQAAAAEATYYLVRNIAYTLSTEKGTD